MTENKIKKAYKLQTEISELETFRYALGQNSGSVFSNSKIYLKLIGVRKLRCIRSFAFGEWDEEITIPKSIHEEINQIVQRRFEDLKKELEEL